MCEQMMRELPFFFFLLFPIFNSSHLNSRARKEKGGSPALKLLPEEKKERSDVERTRRFAVCDRFCARSCGRIRFKIHRLVVGFFSVSSVFRGKKVLSLLRVVWAPEEHNRVGKYITITS
jgi:hypothetical protein